MRQIFLVLAIFCASTVHMAAAQCVNPYQKIGQKYYYFEKDHKLNWFAAAARCLQLGGNLATIENEMELSFLTTYLLTQGYAEGEANWIWISGLGIRGSFLAFSSPPKMLPYAKWGANQPDDAGSNESCVHLFRHANEIFMNDWECRKEAYFICETDAGVNDPTVDVRSDVTHI